MSTVHLAVGAVQVHTDILWSTLLVSYSMRLYILLFTPLHHSEANLITVLRPSLSRYLPLFPCDHKPCLIDTNCITHFCQHLTPEALDQGASLRLLVEPALANFLR
ncbi:hypothetical protein OTU49_017171, partial [Cherax quadricarinatus]